MKTAKDDMDKTELGSWAHAVTAGDAVWLTKGYHSQNSTCTIRNYMNNSLLYYKHQSHKGKDTVTAESTYDGTSKVCRRIWG